MLSHRVPQKSDNCFKCMLYVVTHEFGCLHPQNNMSLEYGGICRLLCFFPGRQVHCLNGTVVHFKDVPTQMLGRELRRLISSELPAKPGAFRDCNLPAWVSLMVVWPVGSSPMESVKGFNCRN